MTFGQRLRQLRKQARLSQEALGARLGLSQSAIAYYEKDEKEPNHDTLLALANFFNVSLDYLMARASESDQESKVAHVFSMINVPVLGKIPAGDPINAEENIVEWTKIPNQGNYKEGDLFILTVEGDSMEGKSRICNGDRVLVKIQPEVESGEIAVVNVNGEDATLKRVKKLENGQTILYPDNPKYDPIFITDGNARICGKVIQVIFEPK